MKSKKPKSLFVQAAISADKIANSIANHQSKTEIGAHSIFLGQIRSDHIDNKEVQAIEYTAYEEMATQKYIEIRETAFSRFDISCAHIYHSLGKVNKGEICFFVFTSSAHRDQCRKATKFFVEEIKSKLPIFGKEIFEDDTHQWKTNR